MQYRRLGTTGVTVSTLCLGTMMFGEWGTKDHAESTRIIHRALDAGMNFVDTADVYSAGESEVIVGEALADRRDDVVLATKLFMPMGDDPNHRGSSRRWIARAVEDSLRRLGTDWIDLYQVHRYDPDVDLDDTLGALSDLVHAGKIRYFGHTTYPASAIVEAQWVSRTRGRERFRTEQPTYSILTRGIEKDVLPTVQRFGMGVLSYSPLSGGWLSGRYRRGGEVVGPAATSRPQVRFDLSDPANQRKFDAADALGALADEVGVPLIDLAIAFVLNHPADHLDHHRPPHDGAPRVAARRRGRHAVRRRPRSHRRDRCTRHHSEPRRRGLGEPVAERGRPAAVTADSSGCCRMCLPVVDWRDPSPCVTGRPMVTSKGTLDSPVPTSPRPGSTHGRAGATTVEVGTMSATPRRMGGLGLVAILSAGVVAQLVLPWVLARAARGAEVQDLVDCHQPGGSPVRA